MKRMDQDNDRRRPVGRVIGVFRSQKLDWTDPQTGQRLELDAFGPEAVLRELEPLGFRILCDDDPPGGGERTLGANGQVALPDGAPALARGTSVPPPTTFDVRLSPPEFLSRPS